MRLFFKLFIFCSSVLSISLGNQAMRAQTFKHIDKFQSDKYSPAFVKGKGGLRDTIIDNKGLRVTYHFDKGFNSCFSIMRNYHTATQDYSFKPNRFTLSLKGGGKSDQVRLRLWEDIDANGKKDDQDEVFASKSYPLGDSVWHNLQFPINTFKRIDGNGNGQLDLNRIRAWDIEVTSLNEESHDGKLYVNDLRFYSNYKPALSKRASLTGTFVTLSKGDSCRNGYWTQEQWNKQLMKMKNMNLHKIIVQYSVYQNKAWYSPCRLSFVNCRDSALNKLMTAAENVGIKVCLGLSFDESWGQNDKESESTYDDLLVICKDTIDELYALFGSSEAFGGWYIPQEINDYDWQTKNKKDLLFSWLQQVAQYAHQKDASKPVIIAPFFNLWQPADVIEAWYDDLLDIAKDIDGIYPQDGVGTTLKDVHVDIPNFCSHIKAACQKHGKTFGVTVESFRQVTGWPIDNGPFSAIPTEYKQFSDQVQEAYRLKSNDIISFEWGYYKEIFQKNSIRFLSE